jgi:SAM-dependent methyltransferase
MIVISPIIDSCIKHRLKNKNYRLRMYAMVLKKELRRSKMGQIILRNLGEMMAKNLSFHQEFANMEVNGDYQKMFWESDLGFLWYQGNLLAKNDYFELAKNEIKKYNYKTILDVGCGWGRFSAEVSKIEGVTKSVGIDISEDIILQAKNNFKKTNATFEFKDVLNESRRYDLITLFGSTDYIKPEIFVKVLNHILIQADKEIIIVNSLRGIFFEDAMNMVNPVEVKRYDDGYLHPLNNLFKEFQKQFSFTYEIKKFGKDSIIAIIYKSH